MSQCSSAVASVYRPTGVRLERASADCRILAVQIDRLALESHLESLLDVTVRGRCGWKSRWT